MLYPLDIPLNNFAPHFPAVLTYSSATIYPPFANPWHNFGKTTAIWTLSKNPVIPPIYSIRNYSGTRKTTIQGTSLCRNYP